MVEIFQRVGFLNCLYVADTACTTHALWMVAFDIRLGTSVQKVRE